MNKVARNLVIKFGVGILTDILKDIITTDFIKNARVNLINLGIELTGKTPYTWDDKAWQKFTETLLTPENWNKYGVSIIDWCIDHVIHTDSKWDDNYVLPILEILKDAMVIVVK